MIFNNFHLGIAGTCGVIFTGIFCTSSVNSYGFDGLIYGNWGPFGMQLLAVILVIPYILGTTLVCCFFTDYFIPMRLSEEAEEVGIDIHIHDESVDDHRELPNLKRISSSLSIRTRTNSLGDSTHSTFSNRSSSRTNSIADLAEIDKIDNFIQARKSISNSNTNLSPLFEDKRKRASISELQTLNTASTNSSSYQSMTSHSLKNIFQNTIDENTKYSSSGVLDEEDDDDIDGASSHNFVES